MRLTAPTRPSTSLEPPRPRTAHAPPAPPAIARPQLYTRAPTQPELTRRNHGGNRRRADIVGIDAPIANALR